MAFIYLLLAELEDCTGDAKSFGRDGTTMDAMIVD